MLIQFPEKQYSYKKKRVYMPLNPPSSSIHQPLSGIAYWHFQWTAIQVMLVSLLNAKNSKCKTSFFNTQWEKNTQFQDKCLNNVDQKWTTHISCRHGKGKKKAKEIGSLDSCLFWLGSGLQTRYFRDSGFQVPPPPPLWDPDRSTVHCALQRSLCSAKD